MDMDSTSKRFAGGMIGICLGLFLWIQASWAWTNYWLLVDGQQGLALITGEHWSGRRQFTYSYAVDKKNYYGFSHRNSRNKQYSEVGIGGMSVVFFSASHPWLSLLYEPDAVIKGWPVHVLVIILEWIAIVTVINPESRWAFNLDATNRDRNKSVASQAFNGTKKSDVEPLNSTGKIKNKIR